MSVNPRIFAPIFASSKITHKNHPCEKTAVRLRTLTRLVVLSHHWCHRSNLTPFEVQRPDTKGAQSIGGDKRALLFPQRLHPPQRTPTIIVPNPKPFTPTCCTQVNSRRSAKHSHLREWLGRQNVLVDLTHRALIFFDFLQHLPLRVHAKIFPSLLPSLLIWIHREVA